MKDNFTASLGFVLRHECVYAAGHDGDSAYVVTEDVPGDGGGLTKFGIDAADHPGVDIAGLTFDGAAEIYRVGEWAGCMCDALPGGIDTAVFDEAVNTGCKESALLLQHAINQCGYAVAVDGVIGPKTSATALAICSMAASRGEAQLLNGLLALRRTYYQLICAHNPGDEKFLRGWLNRVDDLETFLTTESTESTEV